MGRKAGDGQVLVRTIRIMLLAFVVASVASGQLTGATPPKVVEVTPRNVRDLPFDFKIDFMRHERRTWLEVVVITPADAGLCQEALIELWDGTDLTLRAALAADEITNANDRIYRIDLSDEAQRRAVFVWQETDCSEETGVIEYRAHVMDFIPR